MLRFAEFSNEKNEVKEAPTKPKEKEKEKQREKTPEKPSVDPFKRRPHIKPGEEPKPKASLLMEAKIDSKNGMAFVNYNQTDDKIGYNVEISFQGSVMEAELPANWKEDMEAALNEAEELLMKKLPWLQ